MVIAHNAAASSHAKIIDKTTTAGIVGLASVGLPLATAAAEAGFPTFGFDIDRGKVERLCTGQAYIYSVTSKDLSVLASVGWFQAMDSLDRLGECGLIVISVPPPLSRQGDSTCISLSQRQKRLLCSSGPDNS